jgi:hypothetical protein
MSKFPVSESSMAVMLPASCGLEWKVDSSQGARMATGSGSSPAKEGIIADYELVSTGSLVRILRLRQEPSSLFFYTGGKAKARLFLQMLPGWQRGVER